MLVYEIIFCICLLLLFFSYAALIVTHKRGDQSQARVLHIFRLGLSLSALSYLLRIPDAPPHGLLWFLSFLTCLLGSGFLWFGWMEHGRLGSERLTNKSSNRPVLLDEKDVPVTQTLQTSFETSSLAASLPSLTAPAYQVILHAQHEADRRRDCCVDTEHLLLGLLSDAESAGGRLLEAMKISPQKVHLELLGQMASTRKSMQTPKSILQVQTNPLALTEHVDQVLTLAVHEVHRFDKACVGTEHLLLGLVLVGKGKAAVVLFGEGVTVDRIRGEVIKAKNVVSSREAINRPRLQTK